VEDWFGLRPTGRQLREPTGQLVELVDAEGLVCLGVEFDAPWRGDPALSRAVSLVRSFLEYPMVVGLVELAHADLEAGRFVYPTGSVLTVKELVRAHSDLGHVLGPRAALELMYLAGQIVREAAATGAMQGCFSHGGLTPWRITVRDDANVQVIGHGLPQVDLLAWRSQPDRVPDVESIRYAPPERLSGHAEDEAADTAALTILGYELVTGAPLYPGHDPVEVARSAAISEAVPMLSRPNSLPRDLAQVFARSLVFDPDSRLRGDAWLAEIAGLLQVYRDGDGLDACVARVRGTAIEGTRRARIRQTAETSSFEPDELAALANDGADGDGDGGDAPTTAVDARPARWQKVDRPRRSLTEGTGDAGHGGITPSGSSPDSTGRRRRRGTLDLGVDEEESAPGGDLQLLDLDEFDASELDGADDVDDLVLEPDPAPRQRLRRRLDTANVPRPARDPADPTDPQTAPTSTVPGRRRRRHDPA
jgi:hypothetical protein